MPGVLFVVATPIGNLEDITLRALRVLREADVIAAEDTRRTSRLLQHYSISTPTTSLHEHNERTRTPALLARLAGGESVALVSDAGTPLVSDPGKHLVAEAHRAGIRVEPIPGPSAALAALSASGVSSGEFLFAGFPPPRARQRKEWLAGFRAEPRAIVFYEAPHRINDTLKDMLEVLGNRTVSLGRELTKAHEELRVRPLVDHIETLGEPRGEYTLVVSGAAADGAPRGAVPAATEILREFGEMTNTGSVGRRDAVRMLAKRYGLHSREVYQIIETAKSSVK
jgi:16S rRNA (cytidine1402-2'-O)-methyltransferase